MPGWALRRIQKVEMGRNEFLKKEKKKEERERKVEKALNQSRGKISLRYLLELLSKEWNVLGLILASSFRKT